jgi:hypothetical protein
MLRALVSVPALPSLSQTTTNFPALSVATPDAY